MPIIDKTPAACPFCRILKGELPVSLIHEEADHLVIADIQPVTPGHMLVIPRAHAPHLADLAPGMGGRLFGTAEKMAAALRRTELRCEGVTLHLADGEQAGQDVFHVHIHVIPRFSGDGFGLKLPPGYHDLPPRPALDEVAAEIRGKL